MTGYDFDYFVIGAGSGGVRSARVAAEHGARVGIAEERYWGGTCVNVGCVPKKLLTFAAQYPGDFTAAEAYGWSFSAASHDWRTLIARESAEVHRLNSVYKSLLTQAGCIMFDSRAKLLDPHVIEIAGRQITSDHILIATGGRPTSPDDADLRAIAFTSDDAFTLPEMPSSVIIIGGGYIGVEFAGIFAGLGANVTVICRSSVILRGFDNDLQTHLLMEMNRRNIDVRLGRDVIAATKVDGRCHVTLDDDKVLTAKAVMYAAGRTPNSNDLGLESLGIRCNSDGAIEIDDHYQTNVTNIFAIGDVTDRMNLTPVAISEGQVLADMLFSTSFQRAFEMNIPTAVFSNPPIGTVGLTEVQAIHQYGTVDVHRSLFRLSRHAASNPDDYTLVKLLVHPETSRVLGCHLIGASAPELVQGLAVAMNCGGTKPQFDQGMLLNFCDGEVEILAVEQVG